MTEIFKVLQARYLGKFSTPIRGIEEKAADEWSLGLAGVTHAQLKHGLDAWNEEWPPSLPDFRNCCLSSGGKDGWKHGGDAYKIRPQALIAPIKATRETALAEMKKIREQLLK